MREVFLRRQPIFTRRLEVWAYEISAGRFGMLDREAAPGALPQTGPSSPPSMPVVTSEARLLFDALAEVGLPALVGEAPAVFRLAPGSALALHEALFALAPPDRIVPLLVLEPESEPGQVEAAFAALRGHGFRVGLYGCLEYPGALALARAADLVAVSLREYSLDRLAALTTDLRAGRAQVLVTEIESYEAFDACRELRVAFFAGPFLAVPRPVRGPRTPSSRALLLLLARLQDPEVEFSELEALISLDVGLTYRLLRLVNSVWYGRRRIESVRQALLLLGTRLVSAWVTLLLMADVPDKPHELLVTAAVRARMAELLAAARGRVARESAFLVGLLSVLDALLDQPMEEILAALPLAEELERALVSREGELGVILDTVLAYERGDWLAAARLGLRPALLTSSYLDALALAREIDLALAA
ncbi:HDOD domain-containing protein [Thermomicrobium sp. 4228-Ro]|uniref:EAL and HDOD domain-containing protein n=1 Tax=Thermomicrobium sp. 4228-Ro TaxID=2993937 RepID=UPI00224971D8|nr:HDOD domain-containing protein [Thermomicrobium sp. 4228-Ro]MCX2728057.1 HDOD domain-containing protein [Thermomicrobium sp. 4228-Ro]